MITYPIHELFYTFQGEGSAMGLPAFFVRTYGCPVHCTFCDSAGTWHPDWVPKDIVKLTPGAIVSAALAMGVDRMVVTGGEPTIFDLSPLVDAAREHGIETHLETSGAFEIKGDFDWIVVSPKKAKLPILSAIARAEEFKFVIETPEDIGFFTRCLLDRGLTLADKRYIWLHPEWSKRKDRAVLVAISEAVKRGGNSYRAGWQIHKLYQVDSLDDRSRPLAPLGGVEAKGY